MGIIRRLRDGRLATLSGEYLIGRSSKADLALNDDEVSSQHASFRWQPEGWFLRDLGSRNGTFVGQLRLAPGKPRVLVQGDVVRLGHAGQCWKLVDASGPAVAAYRDGGGIVRAASGLLVMPDEYTPEATLFRAESGEWMLELGDRVEHASDQQQVSLPSGLWRLAIPDSTKRVDPTRGHQQPPHVLRLLQLHFRVSRDEEYVEIELQDGQGTKNLGARSHHYMLLLLARARSDDQRNADVAASEAGWVYSKDLCRGLRCTPEQLNMHVHRARRQLAATGISNGAEIVQRRPSTRQLRLGAARIAFSQV